MEERGKRTYGIHLVGNVSNHDRGAHVDPVTDSAYVNSVTNVAQVNGTCSSTRQRAATLPTLSERRDKSFADDRAVWRRWW